MPDSAGETSRLLDLLRLGDEQAQSQLIAHACERLRRLTSRMLRNYPGVRRWEETDDVFQNAVIRLCRALEAIKPESTQHFYNLAALQIRRELIDLAYHHLGPQGHGAKHHTDEAGKAANGEDGTLNGLAAAADEPDSLEEWTAFHEKVETLPDEEQEVCGLLWYDGLTQQEAASVLKVSLRTVKRRWQSARIELAKSFRDSGEDV
jgi:RNA polymerase sigma factor (sigma-70 family)